MMIGLAILAMFDAVLNLSPTLIVANKKTPTINKSKVVEIAICLSGDQIIVNALQAAIRRGNMTQYGR